MWRTLPPFQLQTEFWGPLRAACLFIYLIWRWINCIDYPRKPWTTLLQWADEKINTVLILEARASSFFFLSFNLAFVWCVPCQTTTYSSNLHLESYLTSCTTHQLSTVGKWLHRTRENTQNKSNWSSSSSLFIQFWKKSKYFCAPLF